MLQSYQKCCLLRVTRLWGSIQISIICYILIMVLYFSFFMAQFTPSCFEGKKPQTAMNLPKVPSKLWNRNGSLLIYNVVSFFIPHHENADHVKKRCTNVKGNIVAKYIRHYSYNKMECFIQWHYWKSSSGWCVMNVMVDQFFFPLPCPLLYPLLSKKWSSCTTYGHMQNLLP
jgi:hypothetical protein